MMGSQDQLSFRRALASIPAFLYRNSLSLAIVSLCWFLAVLPVVTIGPATLGAYVAIQDLRSDRNQIDYGRIGRVLRQNGIASALFSGVPVAFAAVAITYGMAALERGSLPGEAVALVAAYTALYIGLSLIPTFSSLARGDGPVDALRYGLSWLVRHPTSALAMGLVTLVVLALTALLTIAFALAFAGVAFSLQLAVVDTVDERSRQTALDAEATL
jgi:hypothetical protein